MGLAERAEQRAQYGGRGVRRHRPALVEEFAQRAAGHQFHDQERGPRLDALVEDLDDAGIGQARGGPGLEREPVHERAVAGEGGVEQLDGDVTVEPLVRGQVDRGHATAGDHGVEPVAPVEQGAWSGGLPVVSAHSVHSAPPAPSAVRPETS